MFYFNKKQVIGLHIKVVKIWLPLMILERLLKSLKIQLYLLLLVTKFVRPCYRLNHSLITLSILNLVHGMKKKKKKRNDWTKIFILTCFRFLQIMLLIFLHISEDLLLSFRIFYTFHKVFFCFCLHSLNSIRLNNFYSLSNIFLFCFDILLCLSSFLFQFLLLLWRGYCRSFLHVIFSMRTLLFNCLYNLSSFYQILLLFFLIIHWSSLFKDCICLSILQVLHCLLPILLLSIVRSLLCLLMLILLQRSLCVDKHNLLFFLLFCIFSCFAFLFHIYNFHCWRTIIFCFLLCSMNYSLLVVITNNLLSPCYSWNLLCLCIILLMLFLLVLLNLCCSLMQVLCLVEDMKYLFVLLYHFNLIFVKQLICFHLVSLVMLCCLVGLFMIYLFLLMFVLIYHVLMDFHLDSIVFLHCCNTLHFLHDLLL